MAQPVSVDSSTYVTAAGVPATSHAIPAPTTGGALAENDFLFAVFGVNLVSGGVQSTSITSAPTGWTSPIGFQNMQSTASPTNFLGADIWVHSVTADEVASPPASWTFVTADAVELSIGLARFRNVDPFSPFAVTASSGISKTILLTSSATTNTCPSATTTVDGTLVLFGEVIRNGSGTITTPSGTTLCESTAGLGARASIVVCKTQATAGATGTQAITNASGTTPRITFTTALRPTSDSVNGGATQTLPAFTQAASGVVSSPGGTAVQTLPAFTQAAAGTYTAPTASLVRAFAGVGTSTSLLVSIKTANAVSARLKVATNSALTTGVVFGPSATPDGSGCAKVGVTGLSPATTYYYGIEMTDAGSSVSTTASQGDLKTMPAPGSPVASFVIAHSGDLASGSTSSTAFNRMLARNPDLFLHLGDWHYDDPTSTNQAVHLAGLEAPLTNSTGLRNLVKDVNTLYIQSDHDCGPNGALPGTQMPAAIAAYKQFTPYTSQGAVSIFDSIVIGRVRLFWTDDRHERTSTKYLTDEQWTWMQGQLTQPEPVKIWIQQGPWCGPDPANSADTPDLAPSAGGDKWWNYGPSNGNQFGTVAAWIAANAVGKVITIHADSHMLGADNGTNAPAGIPTISAAPVDKTSSVKGGPYSQGVYYGASIGSQVQQYGITTITDDGTNIAVAFVGYDSSNTSRVTLTVNIASLSSQPSDPEGLTDQVTIARESAPNEALGLTDAMSLSRATTFDDPEALTDSVAAVQGKVISLGDPLAMSDAASWTMLRQVQIPDLLGMTDPVTVGQVLDRAIDDVEFLTDTTSVQAVGSGAANLGDQENLADTVTMQASSLRTQADSLGLSDAVVAALGRVSTVADLMGLTDAAGAAGGLGGSKADPMGMTDSVAFVMVRHVTVDDPLDMPDVVAVGKTKFTTLSDTLAGSDAATSRSAVAVEVDYLLSAPYTTMPMSISEPRERA